jgi:hypothetical protein
MSGLPTGVRGTLPASAICAKTGVNVKAAHTSAAMEKKRTCT